MAESPSPICWQPSTGQGIKTPAAQGPEPSAPRYPDSYQGRISAIREYLLKFKSAPAAKIATTIDPFRLFDAK